MYENGRNPPYFELYYENGVALPVSMHFPRAYLCPPSLHTVLLQNPEVFGVVEGCDVVSERKRSARETAQRPVAGKQNIFEIQCNA